MAPPFSLCSYPPGFKALPLLPSAGGVYIFVMHALGATSFVALFVSRAYVPEYTALTNPPHTILCSTLILLPPPSGPSLTVVLGVR